MTPPTALVFDFDGTIIDTETPGYEAWAAAYRSAGLEPIPLETWLRDIGKADGFGLDIRGLLCQHLGVAELPIEIETRRRALRDEILHAQPIRDGVVEWIESASRLGIPLAVASSSATEWVRPQLARVGLDSCFSVVSCADPGIPGKPDPTVYVAACHDLGVDPRHSLAVEDSTHGVSAAIAAGMRCIAAPGPITRTMNFDHATVRVDSLDELSPDDWLCP